MYVRDSDTLSPTSYECLLFCARARASVSHGTSQRPANARQDGWVGQAERAGRQRSRRGRTERVTYMLKTLTAARGVAQVFLYFSIVGASESVRISVQEKACVSRGEPASQAGRDNGTPANFPMTGIVHFAPGR